MNEKVEAYLAEKQREEQAKKQAYREKVLLQAGLAEKVYSPYEQTSQEFPCYDEDQERSYKLVFEEVTDEEFARIEAYTPSEEKEEQEKGLFSGIGEKLRTAASVVLCIGIIGSVLVGLIMMAQGDEGIGYGLLTAGLGSLVSWVGSLVLYGFGELIVKVNEIAENTKK